MTDTMLPPSDDAQPLVDWTVMGSPDLPVADPIGPSRPKRSIPWKLITTLVISTLIVAGIVGGLLLLSSSSASAAGGCGGG